MAYEKIEVMTVALPPVHLIHDPNLKALVRSKELGLLAQCAAQVISLTFSLPLLSSLLSRLKSLLPSSLLLNVASLCRLSTSSSRLSPLAPLLSWLFLL